MFMLLDVWCVLFVFINTDVLSRLTGLLVIALAAMALSNPLFDDDIRSNSAVDPPNNEESTNVGELVNDPAQTETVTP